VHRIRMNSHAIDTPHSSTGRHRAIGPLSTAARALVGGGIVATVLWDHASSGVDIWAWVIGLVVLPALTIAVMRWRAARHPEPLAWLTGPLGYAVWCVAVCVIFATLWFVPSLSVLSDAALVFVGTTMLVAALRGYAGCEVLAISNWVLRRDDKIGCLVFAPVDLVERSPSDRHTEDSAADVPA
jgi:hypothetical protein